MEKIILESNLLESPLSPRIIISEAGKMAEIYDGRTLAANSLHI